MPYTLNVYALPTVVAPQDLAGGAVVAIDVLRSSTTIVHAIEAGAAEIIPCAEVEEARATAARLPASEVVLGGERGGLPIAGFHLGNSADEYTPEAVGGKTVVFTSTNGTRAMVRARAAQRILIGAFVNASAVFRQLFDAEQIQLLCAGTEGQVSEDDVLLAGMLVERLQREGGLPYRQNAQAITAREVWLHSFPAGSPDPPPAESLAARLRNSVGGRNLVGIGLAEDILTAAQTDRFDIVPELDPAMFRIPGRPSVR